MPLGEQALTRAGHAAAVHARGGAAGGGAGVPVDRSAIDTTLERAEPSEQRLSRCDEVGAGGGGPGEPCGHADGAGGVGARLSMRGVPQEGVAGAVRTRRRWWGGSRYGRLVLAAAFLPFLAPVVAVVRQLGGGYAPAGDLAGIEVAVRDVGRHSVLLGAYSRFGWHHPGPLLFFWLAGPYRLLGSSSAALELVALLTNLACMLGCALLVRRRVGVAGMLWALLVLAVYLHVLEPSFLRNFWNPFLPLLPFLLYALLCWSAVEGDRWAVPAAAGLASFCIQAHVGYTVGVVAVAVAAAAAAAVRYFLRAEARPTLPGRQLGVTVVVLALLWAPPLAQELSGHPGNLTLLARYFARQHPDWSLWEGWRQVGTAVGRLPAAVAGITTRPGHEAPPTLPTGCDVAGAAVLLGGAVRAARRRDGVRLRLLGLATVLAGAGAFAVSRVVGPLFPYLVQWLWAVGVLVWVAAGASLLAESAALPRVLRLVGAGAALLALVGWASVDAVAAARSEPEAVPDAIPLTRAVVSWLGLQRGETVEVAPAGTVHPSLLGTLEGVGAVYLQLERQGVDAQVLPYLSAALGPRSCSHVRRARWIVVVAFSHGGSPGPAPGQRLLAAGGHYQVYVGPSANR